MIKNLPPTFTVGIATCYGGENLIKTAESIIASKGIGKFRFIVVADTVPIKKEILKRFKTLGVEVYENKDRGSQAKKFRQIIDKTDTEVLIFTQDDVEFEGYAVLEVLKKFADDRKTTFVVTRVKPLSAKTLLEKIIEIGVQGTYKVGEQWRGGDNYLLANGRCMAFRTKHLKKMNVLEGVANLDAYLYLENKRWGGKFKYARRAIVNNKSPEIMDEHMHQSSRFQNSRQELEKYFRDLEAEYKIPTIVYIKAGFLEFLANPFFTTLYIFLFAYSRLKKQNTKKAIDPLWKADISTKKI